MRIAVELNRSSDLSMSRTLGNDGSFMNNKHLTTVPSPQKHTESKRKIGEGVKSITQSQDDMERTGMATKTSFNTAKFRTVNFQRGANGTHTNVIEIKETVKLTAR